MSAIYLFSDALSPHQVCAMHRLGPGYKVILDKIVKNSLAIIKSFSSIGWPVFVKKISIDHTYKNILAEPISF